MINEKIKTIAIDLMFDIIGSFLIAIGLYNFAATSDFPFSGISGIALIFYHFFNLPIGVVTVTLNIPIIIVCGRLLGKKFFFKSIKTMIISTIFMDVVAPLLPIYKGNLMLSAICLGFLSGLGYACIYMRDTSTGGMDFVIMAIRKKNPHLSLGKIIIVLDCTVVLIGGLLMNGDIDRIIYGLVASYILSVVVDKVLYGINAGKVIFIVTEKANEVSEKIDTLVDRGSTLLKGMGGYSKRDKYVVMCACSTKQMHTVRRAVKSVDKEAFLIISEANQVWGNGFKNEV